MPHVVSPPPTTTPPDHRARAVLAQLLTTLRTTLVGDGGAWDAAARRLAVHLAWYTQDWRPTRLLVAGPTGAGKTTLVRTLAEALGLPFVSVSVTDLAETSWEGTQLADVLPALLRPRLDPGAIGSSRFTGRPSVYAPVGILHLDEVDKLALQTNGHVRHGLNAASWRVGRQESLLPVLDSAGRVQLNFGSKHGGIVVQTHRLAVIASGAFEARDPDRPLTPRALVDLGMQPEFADRLGWPLELPALPTAARQVLVEQPLADVRALEAALGLAGALDDARTYAVAPAPADCAGPRGLAHWVAAETVAALAAALETHPLPPATHPAPLVVPDSAVVDQQTAPTNPSTPEHDL